VKNKWLVTLIVVCAALLVMTQMALAFPENSARLGYTSCNSCHVSPTGGGILTEYGRGTSEELATFTTEGSGKLFGGAVPMPKWLLVGGDTRFINIKGEQFQKSFLMQSDIEAAAKVTDQVTVVGSVGMYGDEGKREVRRNYILWTPSENASWRVGKFLPAYNLMSADHTAAHRSIGWGEGSETLNLEGIRREPYGELVATAYVRGNETITADDSGYKVGGNEAGGLTRLSAYLGDSVVLGGSYWYAFTPNVETKHTAGVFTNLGVTRDLYVLAEYDRQYSLPTGGLEPAHRDVTYTEVGYEVWKGVHLQATHEYNDGNQYGVGLQLFPLPHYEIYARSKRVGESWTHTLLFHLNL
jgi:hypothetical protein